MPLLSLTLLAGCAAQHRPTVDLLTTHGRFSEPFAHAYLSTTPSGDNVIVLVSEGPSLTHLLRIHTLWRPVAGAKPNSPAATNAALHYFVVSPSSSTAPAFINYSGTGFVTVHVSGSVATVSVRNAHLSRLNSRGSLLDPLHNFTLSGDFTAIVNRHDLQKSLTDIAGVMPTKPTTAPAGAGLP